MTKRFLPWMPLALSCAAFLGLTTMFVLGWGQCGAEWTARSSRVARLCGDLLEKNELVGAGGVVTMSLAGLTLTGLGGYIVRRTNGNRVGWVFAALGTLLSLTVTDPYTVHSLLEDPGSLPFADVAAFVSEIVGGPILFVPFAFLLLLFPSGTLMSRRWRIVAGSLSLAAGAFVVTPFLYPGKVRLAPDVDRLFGFEAGHEIAPLIDAAGGLLLFGGMIGCIAALVIRFRRSRGVERQQMKVLATAGAFVGTALLAGPFFWLLPPDHPIGRFWGVLFVAATLTLPAAVAFAVLKHRLYDIDVVIRRTLIYATLAALLASVYVVGVVVLRALLAPLTGDSDIAVAATTLAVAALFRPLRERVRAFMDRRFYRSRYDARNALDEMTLRLRNEVALEQVTSDVVGVVRKTVLPVHAGVWLREQTR